MKILQADDHPLVREGIRQIISHLGDDIEFFEASNLNELLAILHEQSDVDLILLDLNMPGMDGFEGYHRIEEENPAVPVAILSASEDPRHVNAALQVGAAGYIPKSSSPEIMLTAIRLILSGGVYVPAELMTWQTVSKENNPLVKLTSRQCEVLMLVKQGLANKVIADRLNIAEKTVKQHISTIFRVFGVTNRTQLAIRAGAIENQNPKL